MSVQIGDSDVSVIVPAELLSQIEIFDAEGEALSVVPLLAGGFRLRFDVQAAVEGSLSMDDCVRRAAAGLGLSE